MPQFFLHLLTEERSHGRSTKEKNIADATCKTPDTSEANLSTSRPLFELRRDETSPLHVPHLSHLQRQADIARI